MTEFNFFKTDECNRLYNIWLSNYPESFHQLDLDRFTNMVISLLDNGENLEYSHVRQCKPLKEEWMVDSYMNRYSSMKDMYNVLSYRWDTEK